MKKTRIIVVLVIILALIAIIAHFTTTDLEFSRFNRDWTGTSELFAEINHLDASDLRSYDDLIGREDTLLLILAPGTTFSPAETEALRGFLDDGNTLFVADERGISNPMLEGLGSTIRIQPGDIASAEREFFNYFSVIAYSRGADPVLAGVTSLTLNRPSSVHGGEILMSTTTISWNDTIRNLRHDANETFSSYGILAREPIGNGRVYVLSDPSVFINGMQDVQLEGDNLVFIRNLLTLHPNLLVEQLHSLTSGSGPVLAAMLWVSNTMVIKISVLILSLLLVYVAFWRRWI